MIVILLEVRNDGGQTPHNLAISSPFQCGITCGAIEEASRSSKAIDERVIIHFRDRNVVIARFRDKNDVFILRKKSHDIS